MHTVPVLGIAEAMRALAAMQEEASKEPQRPVAFAIVDHNGDLLCYARMDRLAPTPQQFALRKAYTSAKMRASTKTWGEGLKTRGMAVSEYGDPKLVSIQGGLPITTPDGICIGGIGVSGRRAEEDEAIVEVGLKALKG